MFRDMHTPTSAVPPNALASLKSRMKRTKLPHLMEYSFLIPHSSNCQRILLESPQDAWQLYVYRMG